MLEGVEYIELEVTNPKEAVDDLLFELKDRRKSKDFKTKAALGLGAAFLWGLAKNRQQRPPGYL